MVSQASSFSNINFKFFGARNLKKNSLSLLGAIKFLFLKYKNFFGRRIFFFFSFGLGLKSSPVSSIYYYSFSLLTGEFELVIRVF